VRKPDTSLPRSRKKMYYPPKDIFKKKAREGNLIPVYKEILADLETPLSAFKKIAGNYAYLLESVEGEEKWARYSFLGSSPSLIFESKGNRVRIKKAGAGWEEKSSPAAWKELKNLMNTYKAVKVEGLPRFCGGAVGYLSYDMVRFFEELPSHNRDTLNLPDALFVLTDTILIFDNVRHKIKIVSNAHLQEGENPDKAYKEAIRKIEEIERKLKKPVSWIPKTAQRTPKTKVRSNFSKKEFERCVRKAKEYIRAGDIIQVVLSQRFKVDIDSDPFDIYRALRVINPSPYMFYLKYGDLKLVGSSPEVLVRNEEEITELRPIAGTRARGRNEKEDKRHIRNLLGDAKENAEHIMLVDLGRNDLGRVCKYGSVKVTELRGIEKYSQVIHIVSNVRGRLRRGKDSFDVLKACFPAGTVSGAPKIRAMEIIEELENVRRGPYAGAVGYFSFSGNLDTCIAIRTIVIKDKKAYIQAGAGIVADSKPEKEYYETRQKAKALLEAIEIARGGLE
jgi:anthranilate synthase component 1